ncbi:hypothetical protein J5Y03_17035 [Bacillus sp. RG28]|uniref:Uncharacterized protein n=1 Tax=Gottfriedia endophytica TaxID=2820819 RepID=A0A940NKA6_9BACI|nr:hypothetical protein [Gottfriedia endophytica]MBP0726864.1 hypothetical protein [Gottfriedia endophytica]
MVDGASFLDPTGIASSAAHAGKLLGSYKKLRTLTKGTGLEVHHLIEKRLAPIIGVHERDMLSIPLSKANHRVFTNRWRQAVPYRTTKLTRKQLMRAIEDVYHDDRKLRYATMKYLRSTGWRG